MKSLLLALSVLVTSFSSMGADMSNGGNSRRQHGVHRRDATFPHRGCGEFSEDAYQRAAEPKELVIIPGAGHVDLYDRVNLIPFAKLTAFFKGHLN